MLKTWKTREFRKNPKFSVSPSSKENTYWCTLPNLFSYPLTHSLIYSLQKWYLNFTICKFYFTKVLFKKHCMKLDILVTVCFLLSIYYEHVHINMYFPWWFLITTYYLFLQMAIIYLTNQLFCSFSLFLIFSHHQCHNEHP